MREIELTRGHVTLVDDTDYDELMSVGSWMAGLCSGKWYARREFQVGAHRFILSMHTYLTGWRLVDHINSDGLDNRRENLRPASPQQNAQNQRGRRASSGYRGVTMHKASGLWRTTIGIQGKTTSLGYFKDPKDGAVAYDDAAREHFGEFARLNFPNEGEQAA